MGTDVLAKSTHATQDGSDWIINGRKAWITNSYLADFIRVVAVTAPGAGTRSLSMFIVDADSPGFRRGRDIPTMLKDGLTGELEFTDVRVPMENVVGEVGDGFAWAMSWINWRRLCRGGMCSGWGQWLLDRAVRRAQKRQSGGKPIAEPTVRPDAVMEFGEAPAHAGWFGAVRAAVVLPLLFGYANRPAFVGRRATPGICLALLDNPEPMRIGINRDLTADSGDPAGDTGVLSAGRIRPASSTLALKKYSQR